MEQLDCDTCFKNSYPVKLSVMLQLIILLKKLHIMRKNKYSFIFVVVQTTIQLEYSKYFFVLFDPGC